MHTQASSSFVAKLTEDVPTDRHGRVPPLNNLEKRFKLFLEVLGMEVMMEDLLLNQVSKLQKIWSPIG